MDDTLLDVLTYIKWGFLALQLGLFAVIIAVVRLDAVRKTVGDGAVLLVTAHPDDESMFFLPTIISLVGVNEVHVLSLSTGNADGLGKLREDELAKAGKALNVHKVSCVDHPSLQDGMRTQWDIDTAAQVVEKYATEHSVGAIVSFDSYGVSGHGNHIAACGGVRKALGKLQGVKGFELISTGFVRKYMGIMDVLLSLGEELILINVNPFLSWRAMKAHASQFVWYRRLFVVFSRYGYLNTLQPISVGKA